MNQKTLSNILSEHRLSDSTLDFLEIIKFQEYQIESLEKFDLITFVNNSPDIAKKIFESNYEVGFCKTFDLKPSENKTKNHKFLKAINGKRKSIRKYSKVPLSIDALSNFFEIFYNITGEEDLNLHGHKLTRKIRNIAFGGSLYPTEIFIINNKIKEIPRGAYRYNVNTFQLELIKRIETDEDIDKLYKILIKSDNENSTTDFENTSVFILFTSVLNKHSFKYQDFGIALSLIEIGEFIHAAYLASSALNLGCCTYGGMINDKMREYLDLKNPLHYPFVYLTLGNLKTNKR